MAYLEARGLGRDFPGVTALDDVDIDISSGRTHVLVGENGAGKSTFVKMVTGTDRPSRGTIRIDGKDAHDHPELFRYVAYVPQELNLFPHMSVAENLLMPFARSGHHGIVRRRALEAEAQTYLDRFGIEARPSDLVRNISVPDQQLLQIARASTNKDMKVLILDEPTSSLTPIEVERVFRVIRDFHDRGVAVVFISHKMDEVFDIGHDYTVLRNGRKIEAGKLSEVNEEALIRAMSGQKLELGTVFRPESERGAALLEVDGLSGPRFDDVSFTLDAGEILGFAGLVGSGRSELMQTIFGFRKARGGSVRMNGEDWPLGDTTKSVRGGMLYLSEERKHHGIFPNLSLRENIGLSITDLTNSPLGISASKERAAVDGIIDDYEIRTASREKKISFLSGGNQQKAIIGRAMAMAPKILIFDEPTKGIDVRTKAQIYGIMKSLAEKGIGIILVSSEMDELRKCASRIITMHSGRVTGEFDSATTEGEQLVGAIFAREADHV
ncbi:MAG: sugar ABC transporter ATP-binding protein [Rhodobacteraceae bacterium]|jgi:ribose transport system ATP-binding protein|uniref:Autoinducer 2 import ATP-binding protein LsrA n=1 Tax=Salipiger profundus TaxID=1229727 RepID=A0A1U7DCC3_9RHOB|nr:MULTISPECIES: sugar ABC transporter ATP-binding protein [Salipiger]APX25789.1 ribose transport system ATP-binding protein [Salipiger profundus]MAB08486.1 sugar ABC transporter ATP-binding protein [Paracoccaceae bacterium]SFC85433.1 ribose transport system ATP-binding protein [Salipiger profundus]